MAERITVNSKKPVIIKENLISHRRKTDFRSNSSPVNRILYLQRTIGNQAVERLIKSGALQAKLRIGQPGDVYEQEADRVADAVMRMPEPEVQRQVEPEEEKEEILQTKLLVDQITPLVQRQVEEEVELVQPKLKTNAEYPVHHQEEVQRVVAGIQAKLTVGQPGDIYEQEADRMAAEVVRRMNALQSQTVQRQEFPEDEPEKLQIKPLVQYCQGALVQRSAAVNVKGVTPSLEAAIQRSRGSGHALPHQVRETMEQSFGSDLSGVRVHTDCEIDTLSRTLNARAFTTGQDIFFRQGEYNPGSKQGQELLAHELIHVLQQSAAGSQTEFVQLSLADNFGTALEEETEVARIMALLSVIDSIQLPHLQEAIDIERSLTTEAARAEGRYWLLSYDFQSLTQESQDEVLQALSDKISTLMLQQERISSLEMEAWEERRATEMEEYLRGEREYLPGEEPTTTELLSVVHSINRIQQPNLNDCWAAAIAMALGGSWTVARVKQTATQAGVRLDPNGGLPGRDVANTQLLAQAFNLRCIDVQQHFPTLEEIAWYLRAGRLVILGGFTYPNVPAATNHALTVYSLEGFGTDQGTDITVIDSYSGQPFRDDWQHFASFEVMADPHFILSH